MEIQYKGHSCFILKNEENTVIITDPNLNSESLVGNIVTISHKTENHNNRKAVLGNPKILDWPGEYEIKGMAITGISANNSKTQTENIIFKYIIEHLRICHLGDFNGKLTDKILDQVGNIDILMIPIGGGNSLSAEKAKEIIEEIDPRIILPMHYKTEDNNVELAPLQNFLKTMGKIDLEAQEVLKIKRNQLPVDKSEIIILKTT